MIGYLLFNFGKLLFNFPWYILDICMIEVDKGHCLRMLASGLLTRDLGFLQSKSNLICRTSTFNVKNINSVTEN